MEETVQFTEVINNETGDVRIEFEDNSEILASDTITYFEVDLNSCIIFEDDITTTKMGEMHRATMVAMKQEIQEMYG